MASVLFDYFHFSFSSTFFQCPADTDCIIHLSCNSLQFHFDSLQHITFRFPPHFQRAIIFHSNGNAFCEATSTTNCLLIYKVRLQNKKFVLFCCRSLLAVGHFISPCLHANCFPATFVLLKNAEHALK